MTYSVASTILRDDYNIFATGAANGSATNSGNVNNLWGTGNGQYGWGQSTTISAVSAGNTITAAQWSTLSSRINSIRSHQTGTGVTFTNTTGGATSNFTAGQIVYHVSNLSSALSTAYTAANTASATTGSMACYSTAQQGSTTTVSQALSNVSNNEFFMSFTWSDAGAMRYFFNAGGYLEFAFSMTNSGTQKTQDWSNLASDLGTIRFGGLGTAYVGYSGTWNTNANTGLSNVTTTETLWWKKFNDTGTADYNNNYVQCTVYQSGASLYFHVTAVDAAADTTLFGSVSSTADEINNPLVWTGKVYEPGTSYITNTWGTVTPNLNIIDYLVVAGGGSGSAWSGGGGGGGFIDSATNGTQYILVSGRTYTATVGGAGTNSTFSSTADGTILTAYAGGNGAQSAAGGNGGSGGGAVNCSGTGGKGIYPGSSYISARRQGWDGSGAYYGGGGGAGAQATNENGGIGAQSSITGSAVYYAGGGGAGQGSGGSSCANAAGSGGTGGGAAGAAINGSAGTAGVNTGGGGGGGWYQYGNGGSNSGASSGGSGIIILKILTSNYTATVTGSPTVTTSGSYTIVKFTGTGTYTA